MYVKNKCSKPSDFDSIFLQMDNTITFSLDGTSVHFIFISLVPSNSFNFKMID